MSWQSSPRARAANLDRLLHDLEERLTRLSRTATRTSREAPGAVDRIGDAIAAALKDAAERFRGRARATNAEATQLGDDVLRWGNDALRKLTHEVAHRPLLTLAVAVGVGALAAGIFARRS